MVNQLDEDRGSQLFHEEDTESTSARDWDSQELSSEKEYLGIGLSIAFRPRPDSYHQMPVACSITTSWR